MIEIRITMDEPINEALKWLAKGCRIGTVLKAF